MAAFQGKEFETRLREKKPGNLSDDLRTALGMPIGMVRNSFLIDSRLVQSPPLNCISDNRMIRSTEYEANIVFLYSVTLRLNDYPGSLFRFI